MTAETPSRPRRRRPRLWTALALVVAVAWIAGAGPLGSFVGRLSEVQSNDQSAFLPLNAESTEVDEVQREFVEERGAPAFVAYSAPGGVDTAQVEEDARAIAGADYVDGPVVGPLTGTEDEDVAQLVVPLSEDADAAAAVEDLRALLADSATGPGTDVHVTGPAGFAADLSAAFAGIDGTLLAVALAAVLVILVAVYRSPLLPLVVVAASVLALALAAAVVHAAAGAGWIVLNGQSQGILFILVVGACTDYALLLVARHREALVEHRRPLDALAAAVRGTAAPILASGGTVILGVLCLLASDLESNRSLGPVAALGIGAALVAALTFLPAVLLLLGRAAFWPVLPRHRPQAAAGAAEAAGGAAGEAGEGGGRARHRVWARVADLVGRRPRATWLATALVLVAGAAFVPTFQAEGTSTSDIFRTEVEAVTGQEVLQRGFGTDAAATPAVIVADVGRAEDIVAAAERVEGVSAARPVYPEGEGPQGPPAGAQGDGPPPGVQGAEGTPGAPAPEPRVVDGRILVEADIAAPAESARAVEIVRSLRAEVHAVPGASALVGGPDAVLLDTVETAQRDLAVVVPLVLLVVLAVLVVLLRSVVAPLLLVGTTVLSFAAALGVGAVVFNHVLGLPGADPVVPLFAFVFLVALGVDYNIFLMTRAREEAVRVGNRAGVLRALTVTGGVITSAGVVLAATFAALAVLPVLFLLQLAFLVAFGVLLDTLVVRSLLVPALALDIGRATWWPSRLSRRAPARVPPGPAAD
ncbi:MMPL family transporter [Streptomonospora sp. S1-112]|uniref:MMPL family transporter n=1 Tax=Streptomonospora mangrovi TaxID=2883123 RepID=A0A9X3NTE0_9ACTN|nr:MMPL family transporter [Streptomonospora mangrovi]MDA0567654.1 MMPL family transporter [Streptomonospora mangrovi]